MDSALRWFWIPLLLVLLISSTYIIIGSWESIGTIKMLDRGGYLYGDGGEVVGLWDGWSTRTIPVWLLPITIPWYLLISSPLWFKVVYSVTGFALLYLYVIPHILSKERVGG